MENKKEHSAKYDLMRLIFIMLTLGVHVVAISINPTEADIHCYIRVIFNGLFLVCNPLFFMLSGRLNLPKEFNKKEDYINYYKKKFISIIIPFFIISLLLYIVLNNNFNFLDFLKRFVSNKIEPDGTLWFFYAITGILLLSPFYSKMLQAMSNKEKEIFLVVSLILNTIITSLNFFNISSSIGLSTIGIIGWHFYYFSGYIIEDLFKEKSKRIALYILGIISFAISIIIEICITHYYKLTDPCILLTFQAFAVYIAIYNIKDIKSTFIKKLLKYISNTTYTFYLLHMVIVRSIITYIGIYNTEWYSVLIYFVIFVITLILSTIVQYILLKPVQYISKKILHC